MTTISLFFEYEGIPIPNLPFPHTVDKPKVSCQVPTIKEESDTEVQKVYKTNVAVFEKDPVKRQVIQIIFAQSGFKLITDRIITTMRDKSIVVSFDRLIFESPFC
jgi:hypothetical protein